MIRFDRRMQPFSIKGIEGIDEIVLYDATPTEVPSIIAFQGARAKTVAIPQFSDYLVKYPIMFAWRGIPVGIVEDFLTEHAVEKVAKYRGRSEA